MAKRIIKNIISILIEIILLIILIFNLYNVAMKYIYKENLPMIKGYGVAVVISGSMAPTININDIIVVKEQESYKVGDIITFTDATSRNKSLVTHRIVATKGSNFVTKGDANNVEDSSVVKEADIKGKVVNNFTNFGEILMWLQKPLGTCILIIFILFYIEIPYLTAISTKRTDDEGIEKMRKRFIRKNPEREEFIDDMDYIVHSDKYNNKVKSDNQYRYEQKLEQKKRKLFSRKRQKIYKPDEDIWNIND